ncbi:hypothetical protein PG988_016078 [Apiospora saccharicola]
MVVSSEVTLDEEDGGCHDRDEDGESSQGQLDPGRLLSRREDIAGLRRGGRRLATITLKSRGAATNIAATAVDATAVREDGCTGTTGRRRVGQSHRGRHVLAEHDAGGAGGNDGHDRGPGARHGQQLAAVALGEKRELAPSQDPARRESRRGRSGEGAVARDPSSGGGPIRSSSPGPSRRPARGDGVDTPIAKRQHIARGDSNRRASGESVSAAAVAGREDARAVGREAETSSSSVVGADGESGVARHGRAPDAGGQRTPGAGAGRPVAGTGRAPVAEVGRAPSRRCPVTGGPAEPQVDDPQLPAVPVDQGPAELQSVEVQPVVEAA